MALTSPDNIWTPDSGDGYALTQDLAAFADTVQDVLVVRANYYTGDNSQMANQESKAPEGSMFFNTDDGKEYRLVSGTWVEVPAPTQDSYNFRWADATERAAQSGMVAGDRGYQIDNGVEYLYSGSAWKAWESDWITYTTTLSASSGTFSVGTGGAASNVTQYRYEQGWVRVRFSFVLGTSGASMGTTPKFTLPFASTPWPHAYTLVAIAGDVYDSSATAARLCPIVTDANSTTVMRLGYMDNISGLVEYPTSSTPWTWAAGDALQGTFLFEPA